MKKVQTYTHDEMQDMLTKAILMKNRAERHFTQKMKDDKGERKAFINVFTIISSILNKLQVLEKRGFECSNEFKNKISLNRNMDKMTKNLESLQSEIRNREALWDKSLNKLDKLSSSRFEINSLFGKNFLKITNKNYLHFLKYLLGSSVKDERNFEEHKMDSLWKSSVDKVENLMGFEKLFKKRRVNRHENEYISNHLYLVEYQEPENVFKVLLNILCPANLRESDDSFNYLCPNQVFISTKNSTFEELTSKTCFWTRLGVLELIPRFQ